MMQRYLHIYLLTAAAVVVIMLLSAAAMAAPRVPGADTLVINPLIRTAASGANCIRHGRTGTGEVLINSCDACMVVGVTRMRRGSSVPEVRRFNVMAGVTMPLPFRGPGRTNLGSIYPCEQANLVKPETMTDNSDKTCITLETDRKSGGVYLVNSCRACRAASVTRMARNGKALGRQSYVIGGKGNLRLSAQGAAMVGLTGENDCPRVIGRGR